MIHVTHARDHMPGAPENIRVLTLALPPENRWSAESLEFLHRTLTDLARETPCPALVVTGSGADWFCGGTLESAVTDAQVPLSQLARLYSQAFAALRRYPALTVAAINGRARDEGVALALSCDFRAAAKHAHFGFDVAMRGGIPMGGTTQLLPRLLGESVSKRMLLCGLEWDAEQALANGLVDSADDEPITAAVELISPSLGIQPLVVQGIRQLVEHARMRPLETGFAVERDWQVSLLKKEGNDDSDRE